MSLEISEAGLDRTFLDVSSKLAEPLCWTYGILRYRLIAPINLGKFDQCETKTQEIATRVLIGIVAFFSLTALFVPILFTAIFLGVGSKICRAIGFALQKQNYSHVRGSAPEKNLAGGEAKIMTWNICGIGGGMHLDHGGVLSWRSRLDQIVEKIRAEDTDVLVLQEVYDTALAEALMGRLGTSYAHMFAHLGANVMGSVSGEMVFSKCAVHKFTNTSFANNDWTLNRTFTTLEIKARPEDEAPCARIIGTHFIHDHNAKRLEQVAQIVHSVARERLALPTVLTGDLNLERDKPSEGGVLNEHLHQGYLGQEPTCTNKLTHQWNPQGEPAPEETIDDIRLFRIPGQNAQLANVRLSKAFDATYNTKTALSDHHALVATLQLMR
jgi:endonuclease/exonuclease/phosphatase family metal-dependent hydrolase